MADATEVLPQHQALIEGSAIAPEVAAERGYRSVTTKAELERLGFGKAQRRTPALLIPIHGVTGGIVNYQARPDEPRIKDGKPVKYESPRKSRMALDVPPRVRADLGDPSKPLFVTEGVRKADAAVSAELCTIALLGVWNWRGTNAEGGKTAFGGLGVRRAQRAQGLHRLRLGRDDQGHRARRARAPEGVP